MIRIERALPIASRIVETLENRPEIIRAEIAGSIRRREPVVKDIEVVARNQWMPTYDLFGNELQALIPLETVDLKRILGAKELLKNGRRYKQLDLGPVRLDLFLVWPPAQWGVIKLIRTGPADFSRKAVSPEHKGGYLRPGYFIQNGGVYRNEVKSKAFKIETAQPVLQPADTERQMFDYLTIDYLEPWERQ